MLKERKNRVVIVTACLMFLLLLLGLQHISMPLVSEGGTNEELKESISGLEPVTMPSQINKQRIPTMDITKVGNILSCAPHDVAIAGTIAYVAD
ncbi:MAG: hypothetical protein ACFFBD_22185, partial [Candidatus Hodarchaeota archaeon]